MRTNFHLRSVFFAALYLFIALSTKAESNVSGISLFAHPKTQSTWSGPDVKTVRISTIPSRHTNGLLFPLQMHTVKDRAYWDSPTNLDLQKWRVISFDIQIEQPQAIRRGAIYFRSGAGWYGGWFEVNGSGWQNISLSLADFSPEGEPGGWENIDTIRIAFWKQADISTTAKVANLRARNVPILILRNTDAKSVLPDDANFADRLVDRMQMWFGQYDVPTAIITDDDLRKEPPPKGTKILILPFNPVLTNQIPQRLRAFTQAGGKLIVAYALDDSIAPILDIESWQWRKATPKDAFASLQFSEGSRYGIPQRVTQDSWNINIPVSTKAKILATWENSQGTNSKIPAITFSSHGIFIGHVLTNTDRQNKIRMLAGLCALLAPELTPMLSEAALKKSVTLLDHDSWESSQRFMQQTAQRHNRAAIISQEIQSLDTDIQRLQQRLSALSYSQANAHIWNIETRIQTLFHRAFSPQNAQKNEFRGVWAHDAYGLAGKPWPQTVAELNRAGMNNLFVNLLWGGAAFYPSEVLPTVSYEKDYAREVIKSSKNAQLRVHAWMVLWSLQYAPENYISKMRTEGRLQYNDKGKELAWLCPSHPANRKSQIQAAAEIVRRYPFDGFHLDYIRYSSADACYCSGCRKRFETDTGQKVGNWPHDVVTGTQNAQWLTWRRKVINTLVQEFHQTLKATNANLFISAAVWPDWPSVRDSIAQDWPSWGEKGWIDFFTPMNYVTSAEEAKRFYSKQRAAVHGSVPIYPGIAPSTHNLSPSDTIWHIDQLRGANAPGFVLFDLDWDLLRKHLPALRAGATLQ